MGKRLERDEREAFPHELACGEDGGRSYTGEMVGGDVSLGSQHETDGWLGTATRLCDIGGRVGHVGDGGGGWRAVNCILTCSSV
jgi:hypothetical protein